MNISRIGGKPTPSAAAESRRYPEDDEVRTDKPIRVTATPPTLTDAARELQAHAAVIASNGLAGAAEVGRQLNAALPPADDRYPHSVHATKVPTPAGMRFDTNLTMQVKTGEAICTHDEALAQAERLRADGWTVPTVGCGCPQPEPADGRLEAIRARHAAATPGPWLTNQDGSWRATSPAASVYRNAWVDDEEDGGQVVGIVMQQYAYLNRLTPDEQHEKAQRRAWADADFIAAAPSDIAFLLAEVDRLDEDFELADAEARRARGDAEQQKVLAELARMSMDNAFAERDRLRAQLDAVPDVICGHSAYPKDTP